VVEVGRVFGNFSQQAEIRTLLKERRGEMREAGWGLLFGA
jgi:hypothetical protein